MGKITSRSAGLSPTHHSPGTTVSRYGGMFVLAVALGSSAFAQPAAPSNAQAAARVPKQGEPAIAPSRHVAPAELGAYLEARAATFLIKNQTKDPFGQVQDPTAKPIAKPTIAPSGVHKPKPVQTTPFSDVVRKITVTTIIPREKRFLIGDRSFKQGDQIPLTFGGKQIQAKVVEVTSRRISFHNPETGETATRSLDLMPPGMNPDKGDATVPGMTPDRSDVPIDLDGAH